MLIALLAALAVETTENRRRARTQELRGRLGLNNTMRRQSTVADRIAWVEKQFGKAIADHTSIVFESMGIDLQQPHVLQGYALWIARKSPGAMLPSRQDLISLRDWMQSERPALQEESFEEAIRLARAWHGEMMIGDSIVKPGPIEYRFPDGYTVQELVDAAMFKQEGNAMGHCIGRAGYFQKYRRGEGRYFSLRTPGGRPVVTMEWDPRSRYYVQIQGRQDRRPVRRYHPYIAEFITNYHGSLQPILRNITWLLEHVPEDVLHRAILESIEGIESDDPEVATEQLNVLYRLSFQLSQRPALRARFSQALGHMARNNPANLHYIPGASPGPSMAVSGHWAYSAMDEATTRHVFDLAVANLAEHPQNTDWGKIVGIITTLHPSYAADPGLRQVARAFLDAHPLPSEQREVQWWKTYLSYLAPADQDFYIFHLVETIFDPLRGAPVTDRHLVEPVHVALSLRPDLLENEDFLEVIPENHGIFAMIDPEGRGADAVRARGVDTIIAEVSPFYKSSRSVHGNAAAAGLVRIMTALIIGADTEGMKRVLSIYEKGVEDEMARAYLHTRHAYPSLKQAMGKAMEDHGIEKLWADAALEKTPELKEESLLFLLRGMLDGNPFDPITTERIIAGRIADFPRSTNSPKNVPSERLDRIFLKAPPTALPTRAYQELPTLDELMARIRSVEGRARVNRMDAVKAKRFLDTVRRGRELLLRAGVHPGTLWVQFHSAGPDADSRATTFLEARWGDIRVYRRSHGEPGFTKANAYSRSQGWWVRPPNDYRVSALVEDTIKDQFGPQVVGDKTSYPRHKERTAARRELYLWGDHPDSFLPENQ